MQVSFNRSDVKRTGRMRGVDSYLDILREQDGREPEQQEMKWGPGSHGFFPFRYSSSRV